VFPLPRYGALLVAAIIAGVISPCASAQTPPPGLGSPGNGATINPGAYFSLSNVADGGETWIQIATTVDFVPESLVCDTGWFENGYFSDLQWNEPGPINDTAYCPVAEGPHYWRAKARNHADESAWSEVATFSVENHPAIPPPPEDGSCGGAVSDPDGGDPHAAEVDPIPDPDFGTGSPDGFPYEEEGGETEIISHEEQLEETHWEACSGEPTIQRWVKVINFYTAKGMDAWFHYKVSRDTKTQTAYQLNIDGAWGGFQVGTNMVHEQTRDTQGWLHKVNKPTRRLYEAHYTFVLKYSCNYNPYDWRCVRRWTPNEWLIDLRPATHLNVPDRNPAYQVELDLGEGFLRENGENKRFGLGVRIAGLNLDSQAGYRRTTSISYEGIAAGGCDHRYVYGLAVHVLHAETVYAQSTGCN
jgi:hypothetical protein